MFAMETRITRRRFAGALGAATAMPFSLVADADRPLLKIGVITDTHVGKTKESCARVKLAYELFREQSPDLIVNVGDIADLYYPTGYVAYRESVEEAYAGVPAEKRPKELFVYAGHDVLYYKPGVRVHVESGPEVAANMKRLLKIPNDLFAEGEVNGFPYVVVPQFGYFAKSSKSDEERFEKMVADAVNKYPGKPVFVFTHVPVRGTVRRGNGSESKRQMLNRYPQVVCFTGHTHGSLREERTIWQGEFTAVSAGCLQKWGPGLPGFSAPGMPNYGALIADVYEDRILFHRFDVRDRKEPDPPWCIPWPFDPATAPYRPAVRRVSVPAPNFAGNEEIKIEPDAKKPKRAGKVYIDLGTNHGVRKNQWFDVFVVINGNVSDRVATLHLDKAEANTSVCKPKKDKEQLLTLWNSNKTGAKFAVVSRMESNIFKKLEKALDFVTNIIDSY